jgi:hypothetical protein
MRLSNLLIGLVLVLPCAFIFALRYAGLRAAMAAKVRRGYVKKAAAFTLGSLIVCTALAAGRGVFPLPVIWQAALAVVVFASILGFVLRGG